MHMRAYGMTAEDEQGEGLIKNGARITSSSEEVLKRIERRCSNEYHDDRHRHVHLVQGRAKAAQVYPRELGICIAEGIAAQKRIERFGIRAREFMSAGEMQDAAGKDATGECPSSVLHEKDAENTVAFDDVTGQQLNPELMMKARRDEVQS